MKAIEVLEKRQADWAKLDLMCGQMSKRGNRLDRKFVHEFATLYRNTCADLALADAYQLPPGTVDFLHLLVARAHNQLYRSRFFDFSRWIEVVFVETPQKIFADPCVHLATLLFWGLFGLSAWLAYEGTIWPDFARNVVGDQNLRDFESMYAEFGGRSMGQDMMMAGFYIFNNAGIGLTCFVSCLLIIPGLIYLSFSAVQIGATFGYMFRDEHGMASEHFKTFVTAHGPFELTAIVLAAGAGLRIGISWLHTGNQKRMDSLRTSARRSLPVAMCSVTLFVLAAFIEGFISPAPAETIPWIAKGIVAVLSSGALMIYFVVLGFPWGKR